MTVSADIPVIDISAPDIPEADIAKALVDAAANQGFVYIKSTGKDIPVEKINDMFDISKEFFLQTPIEEKKDFTIGKNNRGWSGMLTERLDPANQKMGDTKEAFNLGDFGPEKYPHPLPSRLLKKELEIRTFYDHCFALCRRILYLLGLGLETPPDFFSSVHDPSKGSSGTTLRLLHYPPPSANPHNDGGIRAGAHSDYGSITLLFRLPGQAGLEILTPSGTWAPVPVAPPGTTTDPSPPILINIGDLLSYWTNGLLRSTVHRVTTPTPIPSAAGGTTHVPSGLVDGEAIGERYSVVFFCHPVGETRLEAVPSRRIEEFKGEVGSEAEGLNPYARRKVMTADEHLFMRLRRTYKDLYGEMEATV